MVRIITEACTVVWKERTANQPGTVGTVRESCEDKIQSKLLRNKINLEGAGGEGGGRGDRDGEDM